MKGSFNYKYIAFIVLISELAGFLFIRKYLPETKGNSLEEIEIEMMNRKKKN